MKTNIFVIQFYKYTFGKKNNDYLDRYLMLYCSSNLFKILTKKLSAAMVSYFDLGRTRPYQKYYL